MIDSKFSAKVFISNIDYMYRDVDNYILSDPIPHVECSNEMYNIADIDSRFMPMSVAEILRKGN